jgi:LysM repeat protein
MLSVFSLSACSLTASPTADPSAALPLVQATPTLTAAEKVNLELTVQVDTAIPYNTVSQIIKFNYSIKVVRNDVFDLPANLVITGAAATCPAVTTVGNLNDHLDAGEIIICTADYAITQADLDKGSVVNIATANAYTVNSNQVTTTVATVPAKALALTKTANPTTYDHVGQVIVYQYIIKNSGSSVLGPAQFTVTDAGLGATLINCGEATLTLASNATVTCSANYTVTQADMGAATVATNATASGSGVGPSQPATATITKTATSQPNTNLTAGTTIQHTVVEGEWIWQIARCYGADPSKVVLANPQITNPAAIKKDLVVTVPNIGSAGKIYGKPCIGTHTVKAGETWASIAQLYNADPTVLQMVNSSLAAGTVLKVPLNSAGTFIPSTTTGTTSNCVDLTRALKLAGLNPNTTHFNLCGTKDASGNMKIATIKVYQKPEDVGVGGLSQDIASVPVETFTPTNDPNSLIVGDMNYDGNDDFRILKNVPAGPNIPYLYYIYDPATRLFVYNQAYANITSPEFPGDNTIRSQWRENAAKRGIDTYTIANNTPRLTQREVWEAIAANPAQSTHTVTVFNADGTSQITVNETVATPP